MDEGSSNRTKVWLYAVILFTSAFIVLLITAYSQIKFNKNISNIKTQLSVKELEKRKFKTSLDSAREENENLKRDKEILKEELHQIRNELKEIKKESLELKKSFIHTKNTYEILLLAESEFKKGNMVACAEHLYRNVNPNFLGERGVEKYNFLVDKSFKKAALELYKEGYRLYRKKLYSSAVKRFRKSVSLTDEEYFSDDCYYFMAYSEYLQGNMDNALGYAEKLIEKYPDSNYEKEVYNLVKIINNSNDVNN